MNQNLIIGIIVAVLIIGGGVWIHHDGYTQGRDEVIAEDREAISTAQTANDKLKTDLEVAKNEAQTRIDNYVSTHPTQRVYLPSGACKADPASGSKDPVAGGESLPATPSSPQEGLDRFMGELERLAHEADTAVNNCRVLQSWANAL